MKNNILKILLISSSLFTISSTNFSYVFASNGQIQNYNKLLKARSAPEGSDKRQRRLRDYYNTTLLPEVRRLSNGGYHATAFAWQNYDNLRQALPELSENELLDPNRLLSTHITRSVANNVVPVRNKLLKARSAPEGSEARQIHLKEYYNTVLLPEVRRLSNGGYHATAFAWQSYDNLRQTLPELSENDLLDPNKLLTNYIASSIANSIIPVRNRLLDAYFMPGDSEARQIHLKEYYNTVLLPEVRRLSDGSYHATAFAWQSYDNLRQALPELSENDLLNPKKFLATYISHSMANSILPVSNKLLKAYFSPEGSEARQKRLKEYYNTVLLPEVRRLSDGGYHATAFAWQSYDNLRQALPELNENDLLNPNRILTTYIARSIADAVILKISNEQYIEEQFLTVVQSGTQHIHVSMMEALRRTEERYRGEILAREHIENAPINAFFAQGLQDINIYGENRKTLIQTPEYQGISNLYPECMYPKVPRFHGYNHAPAHTYFSLEIPKTFIPNNVLNQIFRDIPLENINIFVLAQDTFENDSIFRPHYYIDSDIVDGDIAYNSNKQVSVSIFNLWNTPSKLRGVNEGEFSVGNIATHPAGPELVASPDNFPLDQFDQYRGALLASVVMGPTTDGLQNKGALTIHYIPPQDENIAWGVRNLELYNRITAAHTVQEGLRALQIDPDLDLGDIENLRFCVGEIARTVHQVRRDRGED